MEILHEMIKTLFKQEINLPRLAAESTSVICSDEVAADATFIWQRGFTFMQVQLFEIRYNYKILQEVK